MDLEEVRRIALLARLELDEATLVAFRSQLRSILDYVAMLDDIDVRSTAPTSWARSVGQPLREDEEQASLSAEEALCNAPDAAAGHFRVPRVLGG